MNYGNVCLIINKYCMLNSIDCGLGYISISEKIVDYTIVFFSIHTRSSKGRDELDFIQSCELLELYLKQNGCGEWLLFARGKSCSVSRCILIHSSVSALYLCFHLFCYTSFKRFPWELNGDHSQKNA